jgi:hypothetical protein
VKTAAVGAAGIQITAYMASHVMIAPPSPLLLLLLLLLPLVAQIHRALQNASLLACRLAESAGRLDWT